jgi:hypothetical protein
VRFVGERSWSGELERSICQFDRDELGGGGSSSFFPFLNLLPFSLAYYVLVQVEHILNVHSTSVGTVELPPLKYTPPAALEIGVDNPGGFLVEDE